MDPDRVAALRAHYADVGLDEADLAADPVDQFESWLAEVVALGIAEPNAMVLSTADAEGQPSSRHVLLKGLSEQGFVFFTNHGSRKARELAGNPRASLCFPWFCIGRQVVVTGRVTKVTRQETEAYFRSRPRESQFGAWASARQSDVVASRAVLDAAYAEVVERFEGVEQVPAPPFWGGYRVTPDAVEFWQGRTARMHDRLRYRRPDDAVRAAPDVPELPVPWIIERLSP
jgi:pyridoxamine 5'-phosphate oxidase